MIETYEFIKNNRDYFFELRQSNLILLSIAFIIFTIIWVLAAGFGSPVGIFAGFIFGKWLGVLFVMIGLSVGATLLYIFANYFLKDLIKNKLMTKFQHLEEKFKKSEFIYLLFYRMVGGIPWQLQCLLPTLFDVKLKNYFSSTLIGLVPGTFLITSIGSGLEKIIDENLEAPSFVEVIASPEIYLPITAFFTLLAITIFVRNMVYKN